MTDQPKSKEDSPRVADAKPAGPGMEWNGKMVTNPAELPPELRPLLENANHNGIPDLYEQGVTRPIIVNGKLYRSVEDVPEPFRADVEKALAARRAGVTPAPSVEISRSFTINGQHYASLDEVPAEQRDLIRQAMSKMIGEKSNPPQPGRAASNDMEFPWTVPESRPTSADKPRTNIVPWVILAAAAGAGLTYLLTR
jgi:hypothetical protein